MKHEGQRERRVRLTWGARRRPFVSRGGPTPIYVSRRTAVICGIVGLVLLAFVLYAAPAIPTVAFGGITLALVLSYPVRVLSRVVPRPFAILTTIAALLGVVFLGFFYLVPLLGRQLTNFFQITPLIASSANEFLLQGQTFFEGLDLPIAIPDDFASNLVNNLLNRVQEIIQNIIGSLFGVVSSAFNIGIIIFGILFVAVYLLADIRNLKTAYLKIIPVHYRRDARSLWDSFGISLSRYLGGLLFIVVIQGLLSGTAFYFLGIPYFILLGVWVSVTAIIPYLGAFLGAIPAVIIALVFTDATTAVLTIIACIAIQQLEGNFLTPRIQGRAVRVHPIIVLLAVIGGGQLAGLVGIIFAVPALAVAKVSLDFLRARLRIDRPELAPENTKSASPTSSASSTSSTSENGHSGD